ncbi:MAG TPA: superinfection immunity protein [Rhizomicrobium sp.]
MSFEQFVYLAPIIYFLPTIGAIYRGKGLRASASQHRLRPVTTIWNVFFANLFLGWTGFGWVATLLIGWEEDMDDGWRD